MPNERAGESLRDARYVGDVGETFEPLLPSPEFQFFPLRSTHRSASHMGEVMTSAISIIQKKRARNIYKSVIQ